MTTEQSRRVFEEWLSHAAEYDCGNGCWSAWQASRTSLLAEIQSAECVEEVEMAISNAGKFNEYDFWEVDFEKAAQAAISVIVKKLKGEK